MIIGLVVLVAILVITRFLLFRFTGNARVSNVSAAAVAITFVLGSVLHPFEVPPSETAAIGQNAGAATNVGNAESATSASPTLEPVSRVRDVSSNCRTLTVLPGAAGFGAFDSVATGGSEGGPIAEGGSTSGDAPIIARGWGADRGKAQLARGVCLLVDGTASPKEKSLYGLLRPDVAASFGVPLLDESGFEVTLPPKSLKKGAHHFVIAIQSQDSTFARALNSWDLVIR